MRRGFFSSAHEQHFLPCMMVVGVFFLIVKFFEMLNVGLYYKVLEYKSNTFLGIQPSVIAERV